MADSFLPVNASRVTGPTDASLVLQSQNGQGVSVSAGSGTIGLNAVTVRTPVGSVLALGGTVSSVNNVATAGLGVPSIVAFGRSLAQTGAVTSVCSFQVGPADGSFWVNCNALVTAFVGGSFTVQAVYTDEGGTVQTVNVEGHFTSGYGTSISGAGAFEGNPLEIRAKAGTTITVKTAGTFTSLTYNVGGSILQIA